MNRTLPGLLITLLCIAAAGCTNDPIYPERAIQVTTTGLTPIAGDGYYELWFSYPRESIVKGASPDHEGANYFSIGRFKVDDGGKMSGIDGGAAVFTIPTGYNPQLLIDAILTVQTPLSSSSLPGPRLLAGPFQGNTQHATDTMTMDDGEAFTARILELASTRCILDAATSDSVQHRNRGIWFATVAAVGDTVAGIRLPSHPINGDNPGWCYQAWLTHRVAGSPVEFIPLGRFTTATGLDANGAGPGAGELPPRYNTPGEDFVRGTPRALNDGTYGVVISLEPVAIPLTHPLVTLVGRDSIRAGTPLRYPIELIPTTSLPTMAVGVDR